MIHRSFTINGICMMIMINNNVKLKQNPRKCEVFNMCRISQCVHSRNPHQNSKPSDVTRGLNLISSRMRNAKNGHSHQNLLTKTT